MVFMLDDDLTFGDFAAFVREYLSVSDRKPIRPDTRFERDLGLTGDDGNDLLERQKDDSACRSALRKQEFEKRSTSGRMSIYSIPRASAQRG